MVESTHQESLPFKVTPAGKAKPDCVYISDSIISKYHCVVFNKTVYVYIDGIYKENKGEIERYIKQIVRLQLYDGSIRELINEIMAQILAEDPQRDYPFNQHYKDLIPVNNGVVDINRETGEVKLLDHNPEFKFTYKLNVDYNPDALPDDVKNLIRQWVDERSVNVLIQIVAQALLQIQGQQPFKKSYLLNGDTNAGKSTYLNFVGLFIGSENISNVSLQQIGMDRFCFANMEAKILNTFDDLSEIPLINIGYFKNLTGRFDHSIEQKYKEPYKAKIACVHVFTCNKAPVVDTKIQYDSAFWDRWEYVEFINYFEKDTTFEKRVFTPLMLSSFLNAIISCIQDIRVNNCLTSNTDADEVKDMWNNSSDIVYKFVMDNFEYSSTSNEFDKDFILQAVQRYAKEELGETNASRIPQNVGALTHRIFNNGFEPAKDKKGKTNCYRAFKWWISTSGYKPPVETKNSALVEEPKKGISNLEALAKNFKEEDYDNKYQYPDY